MCPNWWSKNEIIIFYIGYLFKITSKKIYNPIKQFTERTGRCKCKCIRAPLSPPTTIININKKSPLNNIIHAAETHSSYKDRSKWAIKSQVSLKCHFLYSKGKVKSVYISQECLFSLGQQKQIFWENTVPLPKWD